MWIAPEQDREAKPIFLKCTRATKVMHHSVHIDTPLFFERHPSGSIRPYTTICRAILTALMNPLAGFMSTKRE